MQRRNGDLVFAPTDLVNFLGCAHATVLDVRYASGPRGPRQKSAEDQLLLKKGREHEAAYLQALKDSGRQVAEIPRDATAAERTAAAMRAGAEVIYQAALADGCWGGFADFLTRTDEPSSLGAF